MMRTVRLLMRICLHVSPNWHWNADVSVTGVSGSFCVVKAFALTTET